MEHTNHNLEPNICRDIKQNNEVLPGKKRRKFSPKEAGLMVPPKCTTTWQIKKIALII